MRIKNYYKWKTELGSFLDSVIEMVLDSFSRCVLYIIDRKRPYSLFLLTWVIVFLVIMLTVNSLSYTHNSLLPILFLSSLLFGYTCIWIGCFKMIVDMENQEEE